MDRRDIIPDLDLDTLDWLIVQIKANGHDAITMRLLNAVRDEVASRTEPADSKGE